MVRACLLLLKPDTCQYSAILLYSDGLLVNSLSFQCLLLNPFPSFSWIKADDMWELPQDRKGDKSRGRDEIGHSQLYICLGWMTGYPEEAEAETRSGIFVPYETPKNKLLPPSALPIPVLVLPPPGPTAPPTCIWPHHGKLKASVPESQVPSLLSGSICGSAPKREWSHKGNVAETQGLDLWESGSLTWHGWQALLQKPVSLQLPTVGVSTHPFPSSMSCPDKWPSL